MPTARFVARILVITTLVGTSTRKVAESHALVRYVREPLTGLDFARNAALHAATGDSSPTSTTTWWDDHWLEGLYAAWSDCPDAGGYSGLVCPTLETRAQIAFEYFGGSRGFSRIHHRRLVRK